MLRDDRPPRPGAQYAKDRYLPVFLLLIGALGLATFLGDSRWLRIAVGLAVLGVVVGTLRATGVTPAHLRRVYVATFLLVGLVVGGGLAEVDWLEVAVSLTVAFALGYAAMSLVRRIFEQTEIGVQHVVASLVAYVEVAFMFGFLYGAAGVALSGDFFNSGVAGSMSDFVYFSVVTISTLGYGELTPATDLGRSLAMLETLLGQIFLVVLVAYLVGSLSPVRRPTGDQRS